MRPDTLFARLSARRVTRPAAVWFGATLALVVLVLLGVRLVAGGGEQEAGGARFDGFKPEARSAALAAERVSFPRVRITERHPPASESVGETGRERDAAPERAPRDAPVADAEGAGAPAPEESAVPSDLPVEEDRPAASAPRSRPVPPASRTPEEAPRPSRPDAGATPTPVVDHPAPGGSVPESPVASKPLPAASRPDPAAIDRPPATPLAGDRVPERPESAASPAPLEPPAGEAGPPVEVEVVVGPQGRARSAVVVRSSGDARQDARAVQAALRRRYRAPRRDSETTVSVQFPDTDR
jgi:TonB family protein